VIFRVRGLTHRYPDADEASLHDLSVELPAGERVILLGPSGCGKSTLLHVLGLLWEEGQRAPGVISYFQGDEQLDYAELNRDRVRRNALRASDFGFVLQSCYLLPHFDGLNNIAMPLAIQGWSAAERDLWANAFIDVINHQSGQKELGSVARKMPRKMSVGEKQRLAVLRAIITNPRVVFADEPVSNLDLGNTAAILQILNAWQQGELQRQLAEKIRGLATQSPAIAHRLESWIRTGQQRTLILVSHSIDIAREHGDHFVLINQQHQIDAVFPRGEWDDRLGRVLEILHPKRG
jgi:lipoprotein-releasing system ATP-binding protein